MSTPTKERLQQIAECRSPGLRHGEAEEMARMLLAGLNQEPMAWLNDAYLGRGVVDGEAGSEDAGPGYIPAYREPVPTLAAVPSEVVRCLAFFASVIKSGEPWTATCERDYGIAMNAAEHVLNRPASEQRGAIADHFVPQGIRTALCEMGIAAPETDDELNLRINSYLQRLVDSIIKYPQSAPNEFQDSQKAETEPVTWGAPKTVKQLISQLQTLEPDLETTALLRMPADFRDGNAIRKVPLSISYEKLDGQWLAPYKGEGRKVLAFWAKPDDRREDERGEDIFIASQNTDCDQVQVPSPERLCHFVTQNYANYQGAYLCGKSSEILSYLLTMAGHASEKVTCSINGIGHLYVRCGKLILDPSIKQFGEYPEISRNFHPCTALNYIEISEAFQDKAPPQT